MTRFDSAPLRALRFHVARCIDEGAPVLVNIPATDTTQEPACAHVWVAGMCYVADDDVAAVAAVRAVECETCGAAYTDS